MLYYDVLYRYGVFQFVLYDCTDMNDESHHQRGIISKKRELLSYSCAARAAEAFTCNCAVIIFMQLL